MSDVMCSQEAQRMKTKERCGLEFLRKKSIDDALARRRRERERGTETAGWREAMRDERKNERKRTVFICVHQGRVVDCVNLVCLFFRSDTGTANVKKDTAQFNASVA
jgi:hypothetical protein